MKFLYLSVFLITLLSCNANKENKKSTDSTPVSTVKTNNSSRVDEGILDPKEDLMVVLQNTSQVTETKELINNSGLVWDKMLLDENSLKVGLIRVPASKKDFWLDKLIESGQFKNVKLYSEKSLKELIEKEKNDFLSMRKTPCFGDCPTYNISISKEGKVTFNGKKHTLVTGKHEFQLSEEQLNTLKEKIAKKKFSSFKSKYDNPKVSDLPSTYISYGGRQVQIRLWKDAPNELIEVHEFLEKILADKKYIK